MVTVLFSTPEVSQRIQTAHPGGRQVMLHYLLPWMNNVELVDLKPSPRRHDETPICEDEEDAHERDMMVNSRRWLRGEGWGSPHATTMVLNNLMYMTAKVRPQPTTHMTFTLLLINGRVSTVLLLCMQYGDEFAWSEIENVWTTLADSWPKNLKIILHFLISMSGVNSEPSLLPYVSPVYTHYPLSLITHLAYPIIIQSPEMFVKTCVCVCPQVKRVVVYLGRDKTMQLLEELMCELDLTDPVSSAVTHMDNPPYYRITSSYKIPSVTSAGIYHTVFYTCPSSTL